MKNAVNANAGGEIRQPDKQGRISLGKEFANETYSVEAQSNGDILLRPVVVIHKEEAWLFQNPQALQMVKSGLRQMALGQVSNIEEEVDFSIIDLDDDEEEE